MIRPSLNAYGASDVGLARANNEDAWTALTDIGFFVLADGMGGHKAGEVAAKEAIDALCLAVRELAEKPPDELTDLVLSLRHAIQKANRWVYNMGRGSEMLHGMGTTLCCLYWTQEAVFYAHVGDSRIYRFRKGKCEQLTTDHSLFAKWLSYGRIAEECVTPFPYKNVITRAIGTSHEVHPEIAVSTFEPGDTFLLCSDGLSDVLTLEDIEKILERSPSLSAAGTRLIEKAKIKGSSDNITVLIIQHEQNLPRSQRDDPLGPESLQGDASRPAGSPGEPL